jgi:hypothetical protein
MKPLSRAVISSARRGRANWYRPSPKFESELAVQSRQKRFGRLMISAERTAVASVIGKDDRANAYYRSRASWW